MTARLPPADDVSSRAYATLLAIPPPIPSPFGRASPTTDVSALASLEEKGVNAHQRLTPPLSPQKQLSRAVWPGSSTSRLADALGSEVPIQIEPGFNHRVNEIRTHGGK
jgi:hypothetical protein